MEAEDYLIGRYITASVPAFLQPRLRLLHEDANGTRAMQSLLLTARLHASAGTAVRAQIETLSANERLASSELARAAAASWYAQLPAEQRNAVRQRFLGDLERLGQNLPLPPTPPGFWSRLGAGLRRLFSWGQLD